MRISTKGRYGARAMLVLASKFDQGPVRACEIASDQGISQKYLESLLASLKSTGLVITQRGSKGGYALARPPAEITLYDVLLGLEGSLGFVHCTGNPRGCDRIETCVTRLVWKELRDATERILRKTTLEDLRCRQAALHARARSAALAPFGKGGGVSGRSVVGG